MTTKVKNQVNKVASKKANSRLENLILENNLMDTITEVQKEKNQKEVIKQARKDKNENKKSISDAWKVATKSKSAIKKYISDNGELIQPYLDDINTIYNTNFDINVFNGTLENFALPYENYKIDFDGNNLEAKDDFRNINWYLTLLDRKIKYSDYNSPLFIEFTQKQIKSKCLSMVANEVKKLVTLAKIELNKVEFRKFEKELRIINNTFNSNSEYINNVTLLLSMYIN